MVAIQIREVPDEVRAALNEQAAARGQSLQAFLLALVTAQARRSTNSSLLERFAGRSDGSRLTADQIAEALDAARRDRATSLGRT
jgi:plasmid stability protein